MRKKTSRSLSQAPAPARASSSLAGSSGSLGVLVVVELGSEWPVLREDGAVRRVLAQTEGEAPGTFVERVAKSLDSLFGRGVVLSTVAIACNERVDEAADGARRKLAGLSLGAMAKNKAGKVYLAGSPRSGGRLRHSLAALARGLHEEWRTAGLEVSVNLGEDRPSAPAAAPFVFTARVA
jgi:hypothetical protein